MEKDIRREYIIWDITEDAAGKYQHKKHDNINAKLTVTSLPQLRTLNPKIDLILCKQDFCGSRITAVYFFLQGNGSILLSAD